MAIRQQHIPPGGCNNLGWRRPHFPLPRQPRAQKLPQCPQSTSNKSNALVLCDSEEKYYREIAGDGIDLDFRAPQDFYQLFNLEPCASSDDVKIAFRKIQRIAHPDVAGPAATDLAVLMNAAYKVLMNENTRQLYDAELDRFRSIVGTFNGRPMSKWMGTSDEDRAVFVDETTCIGCRQCTYSAPSTFFLEDEWGRARVRAQWGDEEDAIKEAMDSCPVTCIYFVKRQQLALLEYVMKACKREDTAMMARRRSGNMGMAPASEDPFTKAEYFMTKRDIVQILEDVQRGAPGRRMQDELLAAAVARAWLALPLEVRVKGWPERMEMMEPVAL